MLALIPLLINLLPTITTGAEHIVSFIESVRTAAMQSGEWTDDLESQYQNSIIATNNQSAYKSDSEIAAEAANQAALASAVTSAVPPSAAHNQ